MPLAAFELRADELSSGDAGAVTALSWAVWAVFAFDFAFRLMLTRGRIAFVRREWPNLLLALLLPIASLPVLGPLRLRRPLARVGASLTEIRHEASELLSRQPALFVAGFAATTWAVSAGAIFFAEAGTNEAFRAPGDAFWWSAVTMATVGYGDLSPATAAGRIVAVLTMIGGIGSFSMLTGTFSSFLVERHKQAASTALSASDGSAED